ncbi:hypothetical protein EYZ11_004860 [Aspergillus tanneri]|uniref:Uncharacterized protein n=1 Tax=Aspergillus tanneri TaxID=1220188 RepID=A0A4S3JLQ8_9EURO|nr:uncharacterized protein ATNIH1004_002210 [Aspergillus tanneri]KAA8649539.1 hypothetical protein ATNIH1004_002210 [Aspergillus tanneri]THC95647.1 hypothetical protein EYZ11_004860 [Aspergillus tanneri]
MAMAVSQSEGLSLPNISTLLENIVGCLNTVGSSLPKAKRDQFSDVSIEPLQDGISLLDTKCELLLSYLHNLVFLMIYELRGLSTNNKDAETDQSLREDIVKKLVELRIYLDRGARPLEGRLKYQMDKVIKAAEDAERAEHTTSKTKASKVDEASSDDESASEEGSSDSEDDIDETAYRPNITAFAKKIEPSEKAGKTAKNTTPSDGIYRPPKIMPTALPTAERKEPRERGPRKSTVIDEFVSAEMSSAPMAEPSIGSTITHGGRHTKSKKEREIEAERTAYEETNFTRLLGESKKERAKKRGKGVESTFGGEEWRGLTEGADRISRLTRKAKGSGSALDRSRKRKITEDGPRNDGGVGQIFEKRRKKIDSWKR